MPSSCAGNVDAVLCRAEEALHRHFGHSVLRPFQRDAIIAWAKGKDVLVTLATGAGKSLCYQLPALCEPPGRFALVISPLVALMQDQVRTLQQRQIPAALCGSGARGDIAASWSALESGDFRIVYMCPEFAMMNLKRLASLRSVVCLVAIDEVHCVSSWGHDFRPQYRELGRLREVFADVPIMGATATCTEEVRSDIMHNLLFRSEAVLVNAPMNRSNLRYVVQQRTSLVADLGQMFAVGDGHSAAATRRAMMIDNTTIGPTSSAIIYAGTKACCEEVASWLTARGVSAMAYHAGLAMTKRQAVHRDFIVDNIQIVVATIAFGMGIDKPSIRRIIHYGPVQTLEHYVQQCGRAGRDGDVAECIAFVKPDQDSTKARALIMQDLADQPNKQARAQRMLSLNAELTMFLKDASSCRRLRLLRHFGENPRPWTSAEESPRGECVVLPGVGHATCRWCDVCLAPGQRSTANDQDDSEDFSSECRILLQCVQACGGKMGVGAACAIAAGHETKQTRSRGLEKDPCFGKGATRSLQWWKDFLPYVRQEGFLQEQVAALSSGIKYAAISVSEKGRCLLNDVAKHFALRPVPKELRSKSSRAVYAAVSQVADAPRVIRACAFTPGTSEGLYRRLVHVRLAWQRREGLPGEALVSNAALKNFAIVRPSSIEMARSHISEMPIALGEGLLTALVDECREFCDQHSIQTDVVSKPHDAIASASLNSERHAIKTISDTECFSLRPCGLQASGASKRDEASCFSEGLFHAASSSSHADHSSSWLCKKSRSALALETGPGLQLDRYAFQPRVAQEANPGSRDFKGEHVESQLEHVSVASSDLRTKAALLAQQLAEVQEQIRQEELSQKKRCSETAEDPIQTVQTEILARTRCHDIRLASELAPIAVSSILDIPCEFQDASIFHRQPAAFEQQNEKQAAKPHGDLFAAHTSIQSVSEQPPLVAHHTNTEHNACGDRSGRKLSWGRSSEETASLNVMSRGLSAFPFLDSIGIQKKDNAAEFGSRSRSRSPSEIVKRMPNTHIEASSVPSKEHTSVGTSESEARLEAPAAQYGGVSQQERQGERSRSRSPSEIARCMPNTHIGGNSAASKEHTSVATSESEARLEAPAAQHGGVSRQECQGEQDIAWTDEWLDVLDL